MNMILFFTTIVYFMLPAYFANMTPIFFSRLNFLATPVDFGKTFYGRPLFGKTKTIRGFVVGILSAIFIVFLQSHILIKIDFFEKISLINYPDINFILLGILFGFGALIGDLAESFVKRRIGKKSSESWKVFDQLDYVVGALLFISPVFILKLHEFLGVLIISLILTIITNQIGWLINSRKEKW